MSRLVPGLPKLFRSSVRFSKIILPIQANLQMVRDGSGSFAFPFQFVHIQSILDDMEVLKSLQKPRKITILGDDGKSYNVLMKDKDDLRLDNRFMEFSAVVNEYLHKDSEARHRRLHIRTNAVIPLNESSGVIEWVPNLKTFKDIVTRQFDMDGKKIPSFAVLKHLKLETKPTAERRLKFITLTKHYPPVLGNWFLEQFPTPHNYFQVYILSIKLFVVISFIYTVINVTKNV